MWRQGDLLVKKVNVIPENAKMKKERVLAEGEATGHKHLLTGGSVYEAPFGALFFSIEANTSARLVHEEHAEITFTAGVYEVIRHREYDPFGQTDMNVAD